LLTTLSIICVAGLVLTYLFVINKIYISGLPYFFIVALSSYIWGLNYFLFLFLLYHKQKRKILIISLIAIVSAAALNFIMVKKYLILGDALSTLISTIVYSGLILLFIKKVVRQTVKNSKDAISYV
jgi:O-antigen/teichoic acid export membrane protein